MIIYVVVDEDGGYGLKTNIRGFLYRAVADAFAAELTAKNKARQKFNEEHASFARNWLIEHPYPLDQKEHSAHYTRLDVACREHLKQIMPELEAEVGALVGSGGFFMTDHYFEVEELKVERGGG